MFILNSFIFAPQSSLNNGLMFVYKAENNANDSVGTNNGTGMGGLLYSSGKSNQSFIFNGSTAYIDFPNDTFKFTGDFSINLWVNIASSNTNSVFISNYFFQGGLGEAGYILEHTNTGNIRFYFQVTSSINTQLNYSYAGKYSGWHMITITKVGGTGACKMYIDGALVVNNSSTGPIYYNSFNYSTIGVCKYVGGTSGYVENGGKSDELYIWNRELTATEVLDLYKCSLGSFYPFTITPALDSDACAFVSASQISNTTQVNAINQLVLDLKSANIWSKMKAIYPFVGGTAETHRWNLKNTAQYKIDWFGGGTHSSNGYLPNGLSYGNTNFIPTIDYSVNNSAHISFYSRTNSSEAQFNEMGCYQANYLVITLRRSDQSQNSFLFANTLSGGINFFDSDSLGLYVANRINNQANGFKNGVSKGSNTVADNARNNLAVIIGANNSANNNVTQYSKRECAFASIGDGLTDAEATSFYNAVQTFNTTLNRQV